MASTKVVSIVLAAKDRALAPIRRVIGGIRNLATQTIGAVKRIVGSARTLLRLATSVKALVAGIIALQLGRAIIGDLAFVEKAAAEVATITGDRGRVEIRQLGEEIRTAAIRGGQTFETAFDAAYKAASSGVQRELLPSFLDTANKLAVAGATDASTAVSLLTNALNAYGLETQAAADLSDIFFVTVKKGQTTVEELGGFLFQVAPNAAEAGLGIDQVSASIAALTASGTPTRVAMTQIRSLIIELGRASSTTARRFKEISGVGFRDFIAQGGDIAQAMTLLRQEAESSGVAVSDLFTSVEAGNAAASLAGKGYGLLVETLEEMETRAGATDDAFAVMSDTLSFNLQQAKSSTRDLFLTLGDLTLAPVVKRVAAELAEISGKVTLFARAVRDGLIDSETGSQFAVDMVRTAGDAVIEAVLGLIVLASTIAVSVGGAAIDLVGGELGKKFGTQFISSASDFVVGGWSDLLWEIDGILGGNLGASFDKAIRDPLDELMAEAALQAETTTEEIANVIRSSAEETGGVIESQMDITLGRMAEKYNAFKDTVSAAVSSLTTELDSANPSGGGDGNPQKPDAASISAWKDVQAGFAAGIADVKTRAGSLGDFVKRLTGSVASHVSQQVTAGIFDVFIDKTKSAKEAFKDFAKSTLRMVAEMIIQFLILRAIAGIFGPAAPVIPAVAGAAGSAATAHSGGRVSRGRVHRFNRGGVVPGVDLGKDSVRALLQPGEYVVRAKAVRQLGRGFMDRVNSGQDGDYEARIASHVLRQLERSAGVGSSSSGSSGGGDGDAVVVNQYNTFEGGKVDERTAREFKAKTKEAVLEALSSDRQFRGGVRQFVTTAR